MIWREKTVEYAFIRSLPACEFLAAPLDGAHERAGDAIFADDGKFVLIEFKRNHNCLKSERDKFGEEKYAEAKEELKEQSCSCHFLIYGESDGGGWDLKSLSYFHCESEEPETLSLSSSKFFAKKGLCKPDFCEYLGKYLPYKNKSDSDGSSRGTGGLIHDYGLVAAVGSNGSVKAILSIAEAREVFKLEPAAPAANNKSTPRTTLRRGP